MGSCLCKDDTENPHQVSNGLLDDESSNSILRTSKAEYPVSLSDTVDKLVKETLEMIGTIVDNTPEPPTSMTRLHEITDKPAGWIQLVRSLVKMVPLEHPMGPSVITLLLDDSPLPTKDSVLEVANMIIRCQEGQSGTPNRDRNICIILGSLTEKLGGASSAAVLSEDALKYLLGNLKIGTNPEVMLFSIVALEKFAQKTENKITIKKKLDDYPENPLVRLENYYNAEDYILRQVGFCAKWCLDNHFLVEHRKYSYETVDVSNVNVMLNTKDVSEYLKISADGLEARCDAYSFESVRCTFEVTCGCWYYEVLIVTPGVMQIGWATKHSNFLSQEGYGIGDDQFSIAFDGCRKLVWYNAHSVPYDLPAWHSGSILGCLLDLDKQEVIFSLDGKYGRPLKDIFKLSRGGFLAAASFMSFQQCRFNFGSIPFQHLRKRQCNNFNAKAYISKQDKIILPRHLYLEQLRRMSIEEDSCTLCFDKKGVVRLEPCQHRGFCIKCTSQLQYCPMCRGDIVAVVHEIKDLSDNVTEEIILSKEI